MSSSVRRFYAELKPSHYDLHVIPDSDGRTFQGTVTIQLTKTGRPSQRLTFHQSGLNITHATIKKHDKHGERSLNVNRINNHDSLQEVRLHCAEQVYGGEYTVTMEFMGVITPAMTGLYPCLFTYKKQQHVILATQFESHYARKVFPCIDEPEAKATFQLTVTHPVEYMAFSNTPIKNQKKQNGQLLTTFETTPRMSTYLLAFVVGELHGKTTTTKHGTSVSVWASIAQPKQALTFSLDVAKRSIEFFEEYFNIRYPLAKADHVALPDFSAGAMENWGLITYRERLLLAYPDTTSQSTQEMIAMVIAHETSHQWFGNLVTMRWWNDLWLNESFANLMEYEAVDSMFPDWHIWEAFVINEGLSALRRDATLGVQAIKTDVRHPDEINTLFDPSIVYAKGGRLLYMLKTYIGDEVFRKGLTTYFSKHAYQNTTGNDLWEALHETCTIDVAAFMNPWLESPGFPIVSVDQHGHEVRFHQAQFVDSGQHVPHKTWPVPLFSNQVDVPVRFDTSEVRAKLTTSEPVHINQNAAGHYIVNYTQPAHRDHFITLVKNHQLSAVDRLMLLNNASMMARAGQQSFADVLRLLTVYEDETTEAVWDIIAIVISEARRFIDYDDDLESSIKKFLRRLIQPEYKRLGWQQKPNESAADRKLRATIIGIGSYAEDPDIIKQATRRYEAYKQDPDSLSADLRGIVFCVAIESNVSGAFQFLLETHDKTANSDLKGDLSAALTLTRKRSEVNLLLDRLKDANLVKPQDADHWLVYLLRNRYMRLDAWTWMEKNWQWIEDTYGQDKSYDNFPRYAASVCNTPEWAKKYASFFKPKQKNILLRRNIIIGLAEIQTRVTWLQRDLEGVKTFFAQ